MKLSRIKKRADRALGVRNWLLASIRLEQVIDQEPDNADALGKLAAAYFALCDFEDAQNVVRRAVELSPDTPPKGELCSLYADSLVMNSDFDAATEQYAKALELCQQDGSYAALPLLFKMEMKRWQQTGVRSLDPLLRPMPGPTINTVVDLLEQGETDAARGAVFDWRFRTMAKHLETYQKMPTRRVDLPPDVPQLGYSRKNREKPEDLKAPEVYLETADRYDPSAELEACVFLSYRSSYSNLVRRIRESLVACGIRCWFNEYDIEVNRYHQFDQDILRGINRSTFAVLFTSSDYASSMHCEQEVIWVKERFRDVPSRVLELTLEKGNPTRTQFELEGQTTPISLSAAAEGEALRPEMIAERIRGYLSDFPEIGQTKPIEGLPRGLESKNFKTAFDDAWAPLHFEHRGFRKHETRFDPSSAHREAELVPIFPESLPMRFGIQFDLDPFGTGRRVRLRKDDDVRKLFRRQRIIAIEWEKKQRASGTPMLHHGSHLFWIGESGHFAKTYSIGERVARNYTIILENPKTGEPLGIQIVFRTLDLDRLQRFSPIMDEIAGSVALNPSWEPTTLQKLGEIRIPKEWSRPTSLLFMWLFWAMMVFFLYKMCGS